MSTNHTLRQALALSVLAATSGAFAQTSEIVGRSIDPNTFIVGHPASPRWIVQHANAEHPAIQSRAIVRPLIDVNTYLVQPPAAVRWLANGEAPAPVLVAQTAK